MTTGLVPLEFLFDDERADSAGLGQVLRNAGVTGIEMAMPGECLTKQSRSHRFQKGAKEKNISSAFYVQGYHQRLSQRWEHGPRRPVRWDQTRRGWPTCRSTTPHRTQIQKMNVPITVLFQRVRILAVDGGTNPRDGNHPIHQPAYVGNAKLFPCQTM